MAPEEDFTRAANDPAIRLAVQKIRERYPASYFGQIDVEELVRIAIWETREVVNRKLNKVRDVIAESGDDELKQRVDDALRG